MISKWEPQEDWKSRIDPERTYTRNEACEALRMSGSAFARNVKDNSLWIAYAKPVHVGKRVLYPGQELIDQIERIYDNERILELLSYFHRATDEEFEEEFGKPKDVVFADGTYIEFGGWRQGDTWE